MKLSPKIIAFDADDTLWDCQGHFERVMEQLYEMLTPWVSLRTARDELYATERKNMPLLGYGTKAFTLSMIETALRVSHYEMSGEQLAELQEKCYSLLRLPATPLPGVEKTLHLLQQRGYRMALFTKGELLDQENKLKRSGLASYFEHIEITSDKTEREFRLLCRHLNVDPASLLMVGNSLRSDVAPALAIGAMAVHIPFHVTWELENAEPFVHPRLVGITHIEQLLDVVA